VFLELIRKLKARIYELEFSLSTKRVIVLIGTEKSCPMIVEINSNSIDGQTPDPINNLCSFTGKWNFTYRLVQISKILFQVHTQETTGINGGEATSTFNNPKQTQSAFFNLKVFIKE